MNTKLLVLFFCLLLAAGSASAVSFTDDFSNYASNFQILDDTNNTSGWSLVNDANAPVAADPFIGVGGLKFPIDNDKTGFQSAGASHSLSGNFDVTDFNALGRLYILIGLDDNSNVNRLDLRIGQSTSDYFEYRNSDPYGQGFILGKQLVPFDLNSPFATVGSPTLTDWNTLEWRVQHPGQSSDYNVTISTIWVEKQNGAFNGTWQVLDAGGKPQGWALPQNLPNQGWTMQVIDNNIPSLGNHGRVMLPQFDSLDLNNRDITIQAEINQVDTNWGTRLLFDVENFAPNDNFSSCFIFDANVDSRRVGVEQWVNGTRTFTQDTFTFNYGDYNTLRCSIIGNTVAAYLDGDLAAIQQITRKDGQIGIETFGGRTNIQNLSVNVQDFVGDSSDFYRIVLQIIMPLLILVILVKKRESFDDETISLLIQLTIVWLVLQLLFFGV